VSSIATSGGQEEWSRRIKKVESSLPRTHHTILPTTAEHPENTENDTESATKEHGIIDRTGRQIGCDFR
jgi:hypothetical protein